ncbi:MAG: hypothetical protein II949_00390 [Prevotella sp.]|nr:hypothetical protein [Prevotella sp.]
MKKKERITDAEKKEAYKEASKFVLDIAKLILAGVILSTIMDMKIDKSSVLITGSLMLLIIISLGIYLYYIAIKKY